MPPQLLELIDHYGYWILFVGSAIDHTGLPTALILFAGFAASGRFDIWTVLIVSFFSGIVTDNILYFLGAYGGRPLVLKCAHWFNVEDEKLHELEELLCKHIIAILIWGRYFVVVSRFIPFICGLGNISFREFIIYSVVGLGLTTVLFGLGFYYFGQKLNEFVGNPLASIYLSMAVLLILLIGTVASAAYRKISR